MSDKPISAVPDRPAVSGNDSDRAAQRSREIQGASDQQPEMVPSQHPVESAADRLVSVDCSTQRQSNYSVIGQAADAARSEPSKEAVEAALRIDMDVVYNDVVLARIVQDAIDAAVDDFIDGLITVLESHDIDATNWDGDDAKHIIVGNAIAALVGDLKVENEALKVEREQFQKFKMEGK